MTSRKHLNRPCSAEPCLRRLSRAWAAGEMGDPTPTRYTPSTLCKWRHLQMKTCSSSFRHTTFRFCWYIYCSEWPWCRWRKYWQCAEIIMVKAATATASILLQVGAERAEERPSWSREREEPGKAGSWSFFPRGNCLLKLLVEVLKSCIGYTEVTSKPALLVQDSKPS